MLDEVDAPLDDENTVRFINLVSEMSSKVQFIFVTHNKISMEKSTHLLGVTERSRSFKSCFCGRRTGNGACTILIDNPYIQYSIYIIFWINNSRTNCHKGYSIIKNKNGFEIFKDLNNNRNKNNDDGSVTRKIRILAEDLLNKCK